MSITINSNIVSDVRLQNFIVFEPASLRIHKIDILAQGEKVKELFDEIASVLGRGDTLQDLIVQNRLEKIQKMIDLVPNQKNVVVTKFFDRIWKRYSYLSHLGETFLDLKTFLSIYPEHQNNRSSILAQRMDDDVDEFDLDSDSPTEKVSIQENQEEYQVA